MLPETLRCRVGNGSLYQTRGWLLLPPRITSPWAKESDRGPKPPKPSLLGYWKLFSYPPIGIVSFNTAMLYSTYFSIAVQLPHTLEDEYHWSSLQVGFGYLAIGVAMIVGSLLGGRMNDWRRARFVKASADGKVEPENRLVDQIWGVIVCAAGTLMFGWLVEYAKHPASVLVATFLSKFHTPMYVIQMSSNTNIVTHSRLRNELGVCCNNRLLIRMCPPTSRRGICSRKHAQKPRRRYRSRCDPLADFKDGNRLVLHRVGNIGCGACWRRSTTYVCFPHEQLGEECKTNDSKTVLRIQGPRWREKRKAQMPKPQK